MRFRDILGAQRTLKMKTSNQPLPPIVARYFAAANQHDAASAAACFAADATVHDEDHAYIGHDAIRGWVAQTSRKYQPAFTLMRASASGDAATLAVAVAGQFPGSPVTLDYDLRVR